MTNKEIAIKHATDILEDNILSNIYLKQAAKRFFNFLENPCYYFDELELDKICKFIQKLTLSEDFVGQFFMLQSWSIFFIASVYAFKYKEGEEKDCRVVKQAVLEIPRKNAKSMIASALALYDLLTSNNQAQIYLVATSRENVKAINFKKVKEFSKQIDRTGKVIKPRYNSLLYKGNILTALSSDAGRHQGYSPSTVIIDEAHEIQSGELFQVFQRGMGSRKKRLTLIITSSGNDTNVYYYQLREQYIKILFNEIQDDSVCAHIYCLDEGDDYTDENNWIKANPNLGVSCLKSYLQGEVHTAETNSLDRNSVLTYNFGVWLKSSSIETWIEEKYFDAAYVKLNIEDFKGRECTVGVDLASVGDTTAITFMFSPTPEDDNYYFFNKCYLPSDNINTNVNKLLFREAAANGELIITEGNVTDYQYLLNDIIKQNNDTPVQAIYYDSHNSSQFIISCTEEGFYTMPFSQSNGNMNEPIKQFERLIRLGKIKINLNNLTRWQWNNVVIDEDPRFGNYKLKKKTRSRKIDIPYSTIDAFGGLMRNPSPNFTVV